jgi:hypothetical protein
LLSIRVWDEFIFDRLQKFAGWVDVAFCYHSEN